MAIPIFLNQTANITSPIIRVNGVLQVDVSGELGGADVITHEIQDNGAKAPLKCCSWRASQGEIIPEGADSGQQLMNNRCIQFEILNASLSTNVSLYYDAQ
jgi:hypothetical protein